LKKNVRQRWLFLITISLILSTEIKAQHKLADAAFIITSQNDTIHGFVDEESLLTGDLVYLQTNRSSRLLKTYLLKDITKIVVVPDKIYFPRFLSYKNQGRQTLMRLTLEGEVSIFFTRFKKRNKSYFLEKDGSLYAVSPSNFSGFINTLYGDCDSWKSLVPNPKQLSYTYEKLLNLTIAYNKCRNSQRPSIIYVPPEKRGGFYGLRMVAAINEVKLPEISYYSELDARTAYASGGFMLGYQANNHLILKTEFNLIQRGARQNGVNVPPLNRKEIVSDFDFDFAFLEVTLLIQYNIGRRSLNGYLLGGPAVSHIIWSEATELKSTPMGIVPGQDTGLSSGVLLGVYGGGGLSYSINNRYDFFLEGRYGVGLNKLRSTILTWDLTLTTLQLGIGLIRRI